jgi:spore germination cell wall hydrolase CwlJ-like protein
MKFGMRAAHRRADCALLLAAGVALLSAVPALAYNLYTDESVRATLAPDQPVVMTESPVEQAVAALGEEQSCLAEAMYYEARGEGQDGQKAIAEVILQRTHNVNYPKTICGVVHEGARRHTGCQFSYTCDGSMSRPKNPIAWRRVRELAGNIMEGAVRLGYLTGRATHFHAVDVQPVWAEELVRTTQIGNHIFYRRDSTRGS